MPDRIHSEEELDEVLTRPSPTLIEFIRGVSNPLVILGAGGKMGFSLAVLAQRAAAAANSRIEVFAVSRFWSTFALRATASRSSRKARRSRALMSFALTLLLGTKVLSHAWLSAANAMLRVKTSAPVQWDRGREGHECWTSNSVCRFLVFLFHSSSSVASEWQCATML